MTFSNPHNHFQRGKESHPVKVTKDRSRETQQGRHIPLVMTFKCPKDAQFLSKCHLWAKISSVASRPASIASSSIMWTTSPLSGHLDNTTLLLLLILLNCCVLSILYQRYVSITVYNAIWILASSAGKQKNPHAARPLIGLYLKTTRRAVSYVIAARYFSPWTPYVVKQSSRNSCTQQL